MSCWFFTMISDTGSYNEHQQNECRYTNCYPNTQSKESWKLKFTFGMIFTQPELDHWQPSDDKIGHLWKVKRFYFHIGDGQSLLYLSYSFADLKEGDHSLPFFSLIHTYGCASILWLDDNLDHKFVFRWNNFYGFGFALAEIIDFFLIQNFPR